MYLKSKWISVLKLKNILFLLTGLFFTIMSVWDIVSLTVYYWGDWNTVIHARSTPESVCLFFIGCVILMCMKISANAIRKAHFYSSYFETELYSDVGYDELSQATGYTANKVRRDLHIFRRLYMKRFSFVRNDEGEEHIELYSKTVECSCKNCGAVIDKKIYFAGICPYCKTSDVFAAVITDSKVYSIRNDTSKNRNNPEYYLQKSFWAKAGWRIIALSLSIIAILLFLTIAIDYTTKYNDQEYLLHLVLSGEGYASIELNQKHIINFILFDIFFALIFVPIVFIIIKKLSLMVKARNFSYIFANSKTPFLNFSVLKTKNSNVYLRKTLQNGYIRHCTIEKHDGKMKIALAKKIVKDSCPSCGASITEAVNENYICKFCKNRIIKVIEKK